MRDDDGVARETLDNRAHPLLQVTVAFAAGRPVIPDACLAGCHFGWPLGGDLGPGLALEFAEGQFDQAFVEACSVSSQPQFTTDDLHGFGGADERACEIIISGWIGQPVLQGTAVARGLATAFLIDRNIGLTLHAASDVPVGFAVPDEIEGDASRNHARNYHAPSPALATEMSGASSFFMPWTW